MNILLRLEKEKMHDSHRGVPLFPFFIIHSLLMLKNVFLTLATMMELKRHVDDGYHYYRKKTPPPPLIQ